MGKKVKKALTDIKVSKKLTLALLVILIEFLRGFGLELPKESYEVIKHVAMVYLSGQSVVDVALVYVSKNNV